MKYIFILLIIINAGYWSWQSFLGDWFKPKPATEQTISLGPNEAQIQLLAEPRPGQEGTATTTSPATPDTITQTPPADAQGLSATAPAPTKCYKIVESNQTIFNALQQWASNQSISMIKDPLPAHAIRDYRAWIPPHESRTAALETLAKLKEMNIDSFIINNGDERNGISLGVFGREKDAEQLVKLMKKKGYSAEVKPRYRGSITLSATVGNKQLGLNDLQQKEIKAQFGHSEITEISCK